MAFHDFAWQPGERTAAESAVTNSRAGEGTLLSVVGARPQFVKMAVVDRAIRVDRSLDHVIIHTGQHYDDNMSRTFFRELEIPEPDMNLEVGSASHGVQTGAMLERLERAFGDTCPDWVLVYGDTNSTLAGALAAAKMHIRVAHVEGGLRSFNRSMPEEINRVVTDHVSDRLFAPTEAAVANLLREGVQPTSVHRVGDVMYDAALFYAHRSDRSSRVLGRLQLDSGAYVLATVHRAENTDRTDRLTAIMNGLAQVAEALPVVLPLHPRTRAACREVGLDLTRMGLTIIDPVGYLDMVVLERNARVIATDSGGVQKEAYFYNVPCVTLRDETEWVELVDLGVNLLVGADSKAIASTVLDRKPAAPEDRHLYGEGDAADRIVEILKEAGPPP